MRPTNPISHFKSGFVAVVGRPNVGKSTLINTFIGQKISAVSSKPQTTRFKQLGILTEEDAQIVFVDTPGIHEPKHALGKGMNAIAQEALIDADIVLWLVDISRKPHAEDRIIAERLKGLPSVIQALNKIDLVTEDDELTQKQYLYKKLLPSVEQIVISALEGSGFDNLYKWLLSYLSEGPPYYPEEQITDINEREIAADLIREAALNKLHDEIPHSIAVRIDEYKERGVTGAFIAATIFVERDSQKGIVIGGQGGMLKKIGTAARKAIEAMSSRTIFLDLRVKIKKNWRTDSAFLKKIGYSNLGED